MVELPNPSKSAMVVVSVVLALVVSALVVSAVSAGALDKVTLGPVREPAGRNGWWA